MLTFFCGMVCGAVLLGLLAAFKVAGRADKIEGRK